MTENVNSSAYNSKASNDLLENSSPCNSKRSTDFSELFSKRSSPCNDSKRSIYPRSLFVGNLWYKVNEASLRRLFQKFGAVADIVIMRNHRQVFGFVQFHTAAAVGMCLEQHAREPLVCDNKVLDIKRRVKKAALAAAPACGLPEWSKKEKSERVQASAAFLPFIETESQPLFSYFQDQLF